jgi:hypothetical protein
VALLQRCQKKKNIKTLSEGCQEECQECHSPSLALPSPGGPCDVIRVAFG